MRNPRNFAKPLAIGAPVPPIEIPMRPSRMIHFFDPSNPRMAVKVPELVEKLDKRADAVVLGDPRDKQSRMGPALSPQY